MPIGLGKLFQCHYWQPDNVNRYYPPLPLHLCISESRTSHSFPSSLPHTFSRFLSPSSSLPHSLTSLPPFLPPSLSHSLPPFLPPSLPHTLTAGTKLPIEEGKVTTIEIPKGKRELGLSYCWCEDVVSLHTLTLSLQFYIITVLVLV